MRSSMPQLAASPVERHVRDLRAMNVKRHYRRHDPPLLEGDAQAVELLLGGAARARTPSSSRGRSTSGRTRQTRSTGGRKRSGSRAAIAALLLQPFRHAQRLDVDQVLRPAGLFLHRDEVVAARYPDLAVDLRQQCRNRVPA